ncbi:zinc finger C2HC domain-containing protein 1A [Centroberyx gerrardi]
MEVHLVSQEHLSNGIREATGSQQPRRDSPRLPNAQQRVAKAIHAKELLLQEKLQRIEKKIRNKIQRESTAAGDDEQRSEEEEEERHGRRRAEQEKERRETRMSLAEQQRREPAKRRETPSRLQRGELGPRESTDTQLQLLPCEICGRKFSAERLEKHLKICEKAQQSHRKVFNSYNHRTKGTSLEEFLKTHTRSHTPERKNNWRKNHEVFIRNMRQGHDPGGTHGGTLQPQPSAPANPDYVTCPHCSRRFGPGPAERHIPKCQNIKSRPPPPRYRQ